MNNTFFYTQELKKRDNNIIKVILINACYLKLWRLEYGAQPEFCRRWRKYTGRTPALCVTSDRRWLEFLQLQNSKVFLCDAW